MAAAMSTNLSAREFRADLYLYCFPLPKDLEAKSQKLDRTAAWYASRFWSKRNPEKWHVTSATKATLPQDVVPTFTVAFKTVWDEKPSEQDRLIEFQKRYDSLRKMVEQLFSTNLIDKIIGSHDMGMGCSWGRTSKTVMAFKLTPVPFVQINNMGSWVLKCPSKTDPVLFPVPFMGSILYELAKVPFEPKPSKEHRDCSRHAVMNCLGHMIEQSTVEYNKLAALIRDALWSLRKPDSSSPADLKQLVKRTIEQHIRLNHLMLSINHHIHLEIARDSGCVIKRWIRSCVGPKLRSVGVDDGSVTKLNFQVYRDILSIQRWSRSIILLTRLCLEDNRQSLQRAFEQAAPAPERRYLPSLVGIDAANLTPATCVSALERAFEAFQQRWELLDKELRAVRAALHIKGREKQCLQAQVVMKEKDFLSDSASESSTLADWKADEKGSW